MHDLNKYIRNKALEEGIDIVGFSSCKKSLSSKKILEEKIKNGKFTEFESTNIEERIDPEKYFKSCKSIISIGLSYNMDKPKLIDTSKKFKGNLSRSSWGLDYHLVLKNKMEALVGHIKEISDIEYRIVVDTSPLIDRDIANRSGIGQYGKNCSIINKDFGSFIFLGHILTNLDLKNNEYKREDICGSCRLCLDACPTGALEKAYYINPKKCISYLTQTKEEIPSYLRDKMGIQIYGCDICQEVCPKNKKREKNLNMEFYPKKTQGKVDLLELFKMSNREFKAKYGDKSGGWRGRNVFKRNAIIALGNIKDKESLPILFDLLGENDERFNKYIIWAIEKIEG